MKRSRQQRHRLARQMIARYNNDGLTYRELAKQYNMAVSTCYALIHGYLKFKRERQLPSGELDIIGTLEHDGIHK